MDNTHASSATLEQLSASQQITAAKLINRDLAYRSIPGTFMYLVGWFFLYFVIKARSDDATTAQWLFYFSVIAVFGAALRIGCIFLAHKLSEQINLSRAYLALGMMINCLSWGVMAALAFVDTPLAPHTQIILLTTAGLSAGGAISFSASRLFTGLFLGGMLLPVAIVQIGVVDQVDFEVLVAVLLYFLGMYMVTMSPNREYISALVSNLMLLKLSHTDGLTGLCNRRAFDRHLYEEVQRAQRATYPLSLLLIDIDHFKKINDQHGHPAGDYCLENLAQLLEDSVGRISDTIARYGGEEFAVILPKTSADSAHIVAERIRQRIAAAKVSFEGTAIPLTISLGCCTVDPVTKQTTPEDLISRADKALYCAKDRGRNRVEYFEM